MSNLDYNYYNDGYNGDNGYNGENNVSNNGGYNNGYNDDNGYYNNSYNDNSGYNNYNNGYNNYSNDYSSYNQQNEYQQPENNYQQQPDYQQQPNYQQANYQQENYQQENYQQENYQQQPNYQQNNYQQSNYQQTNYQQAAGSCQQAMHATNMEEASKRVLMLAYFSIFIPLALASLFFMIVPIFIISVVFSVVVNIQANLVVTVFIIGVFALPAVRLYMVWQNPIKTIINYLPRDYSCKVLNGPVCNMVQNISNQMGINTPTLYLMPIVANAFALKDYSSSAIFISEDLYDECTDDELKAIITNELIHLNDSECIHMTRIVAITTLIEYYCVKGIPSSSASLHNSAILGLFTKRSKLEPENTFWLIVKLNLIDFAACFVIVIIFCMAPVLGITLLVAGFIIELIANIVTFTYITNAVFYKFINFGKPYRLILKYIQSNINWARENEMDMLTAQCTQDPKHLASLMHRILQTMNTYKAQRFNNLLRGTYAEPLLLAGFNPYYMQERTDLNRFETLCAMHPGLASQFEPLRYLDQEKETKKEDKK